MKDSLMVEAGSGSGIAACVFDAYGTVFDVNAPVRRLTASLGDKAEPLTRLWRTRQLEYTWLRSLMQTYADFWQVTGEALDYALAALQIADPVLRARLMELYLAIDPWPDARPVLESLKAAGLPTAILSNGSPTMLTAAVDTSNFYALLDAVLSVDAVKTYKPAPQVYQLACTRFGLAPERIAFVSANGWDAAGAAQFGFTVFRLNRDGQPEERLPGKSRAVLPDLTALPAALKAAGWVAED